MLPKLTKEKITSYHPLSVEKRKAVITLNTAFTKEIETRGVKINTFSPCIMSRQEIDNLLVQNRNRNIDDNKYLYTVFALVY